MEHIIKVRGQIGNDYENGVVTKRGFTVATFYRALTAAQAAKATKLVLEIDSAGGAVYEGFAIYAELKKVKMPTEARIMGRCASIATIIALACDVVTMETVGAFMIHKPWLGLNGGHNSTDLDVLSEGLKSLDEQMLEVYRKKTKLPRNQIREWMEIEREFSPQEARKFGFIDKIRTSKTVAFASFEKPLYIRNENFDKMSKEIQLGSTLGNLLRGLLGGGAQASATDVNDEPVVKAEDFALQLADGTEILIESVNGELAVGDVVRFISSGEIVPDADHILADGRIIRTEGGVITEVMEANAHMKAYAEMISANAKKAAAPVANAELAPAEKPLFELGTDANGKQALVPANASATALVIAQAQAKASGGSSPNAPKGGPEPSLKEKQMLAARSLLANPMQ